MELNTIRMMKLEQLGILVDCESPLEISSICGSSRATGTFAEGFLQWIFYLEQEDAEENCNGTSSL